LAITASGVLAVALIVCGGIVAKQHLAHPTRAPHASVTLQASPAKPFSAPRSWPLKFDSTFLGDQLDTQVWATCYPWWGVGGGCTNFGNSSDPELEWYQAPQDQVSGGDLHLVAQREPTPGISKQGTPKEYACRSGMVTTYPSFRFEYGYVQITAKVPFGKGLWPAFWLASANEKSPPEIDILEHWASEPYGKVYLHPLSGARQGGSVSMPDLSAGWHTFGLYWTKTELVWTYDGQQVFATSTGVPQQDMYLIANLADDNTGPGSCSGSLDIKSVKVWQP
jgi:beta-glucanase (GH16 family)